jgi:hypothetical protein
MKKIALLCLAANVALVFVAAAVVGAADVSQGKCVAYEKEKNTITLEEYDTHFSKDNPHGQPTGQTSVYNVSKAAIGLLPEPGDILRIAYQVQGSERMAFKVMNVTKQDLRKK